MIRRLQGAGEFTILASVNKYTKGFDVPDVECIIDARPNMTSLASLIQKMGRGMRSHPGKAFCLYLDHAGNVEGWYEEVVNFWASGVDSLDVEETGAQKRKEGDERTAFECGGCGRAMPKAAKVCPACGWEAPQRASGVETVAGKATGRDRSHTGRSRVDQRQVADVAAPCASTLRSAARTRAGTLITAGARRAHCIRKSTRRRAGGPSIRLMVGSIGGFTSTPTPCSRPTVRSNGRTLGGAARSSLQRGAYDVYSRQRRRVSEWLCLLGGSLSRRSTFPR